MTVDEAARILRKMYEDGSRMDRSVTAVHLFGIKYADELNRLPIKEIVLRAGLYESYQTEIGKGRNLAEYVTVTKEL